MLYFDFFYYQFGFVNVIFFPDNRSCNLTISIKIQKDYNFEKVISNMINILEYNCKKKLNVKINNINIIVNDIKINN